MSLIEIRNLSVSYEAGRPSAALNNVTLRIDEGESVAITGPSGSGKSTLLAVIGGLLKQTSGDYFFRGNLISQLSDRQMARFRGEQIGFVFQNILLLPHLSLVENVMVPIDYLSSSGANARERAMQMLEVVGIAHLATRRPKEVSGGQAQRAAIARALIRNPRVILADEPTGSLDESSAHEVLSILKGLETQGITVLVVTHSSSVSAALGRNIHIDAGRIATPSSLTLCA